MNIHFEILTKDNYPFYSEQLISLYLKVFTSGKNAQFLTKKEVEKTFDDLLKIGDGLMALEESNAAGLIMGFPAKFENEFHFEKQTSLKPENTLYIAEVMTDILFQGKGIASKLIENYLDLKKEFTDVLIRVWEKNLPALSLYKKLGFADTGMTISQTKHLSETETFKMKKIYLKRVLK